MLPEWVHLPPSRGAGWGGVGGGVRGAGRGKARGASHPGSRTADMELAECDGQVQRTTVRGGVWRAGWVGRGVAWRCAVRCGGAWRPADRARRQALLRCDTVSVGNLTSLQQFTCSIGGATRHYSTDRVP